VPSLSAPYGQAMASRGDRLDTLRTDYRDQTETGFGVPTSRHRSGWIRVR
jgi:hypothetical protein